MFIKKSILTTLLIVAFSGCASTNEVQNILVIGWDGAQRDHVKEMLSRDELPVLSTLAQEGKIVDIDITDGATDTKAGWTQIFTGYTSEITGVYSNRKYQPIPQGYTVFERAERHFGPDNIDTIAIIGKKGNIGNAPPRKIPYKRWQARTQNQQTDTGSSFRIPRSPAVVFQESGKRFVRFPGEPWHMVSDHMDLFVNGLGTNQEVGTRALEELDKHKDNRLLMFIHFAQPDHAGHKYGENSAEYTNALKDDDEWTGRIIDKLKQLSIYEKTAVYVSADHGFDEGQITHNCAPYVFLTGNDPSLIRDGDRMDIAPTLLKRLGINIDQIAPPFDGTPLDEKPKPQLNRE